MPVEIRELIIRAVAAAPPREPAAEDEDGDELPSLSSEPDHDREAIVQECVRQVLRILQQQKGR
jgi:hypothetical protein